MSENGQRQPRKQPAGRSCSTLLLAIVVIIIAIILGGCAAWQSSHNYNAPPPQRQMIPQWTRIEDPGNFPSIIRACVNGDGIYIAQDGANGPEVIPGDPACTTSSP